MCVITKKLRSFNRHQTKQQQSARINMSTSGTTSIDPRQKHACEIEVTFATNLQAEHALQVMQVDEEPSDRVTKSYQLIQQSENDNHTTLMKVRFESKELKMLRVSVSSFYDYLGVVIKTFREFDDTGSL
jgi:hypothetical protein